MIRTQISVDEHLYRMAKKAARKRGISLAEFCRRSLAAALVAEESDKPWMKMAGTLNGEFNDSASVDRVVYNRVEL